MSAVLDIVPARTALPTLVAAAGGKARERFLEFFAAQIRNKHTRRAYAQATGEFLAWCETAGVASIADVRPLHVAAYVEQLGRTRSAPTVKQRLAAILQRDNYDGRLATIKLAKLSGHRVAIGTLLVLVSFGKRVSWRQLL